MMSETDLLVDNDRREKQMRLCSLSQSPEAVSQNDRRKLSTFFGVVVPCCLSMFSVILFLRMGFIIGQAGLYESLAMLVLAYLIIGLTVLSICAISTNGAIEGGGAYYMISRALGPEFGGAIGLMFFLANVASTALYIFGIVEALTSYFGEAGQLKAGILARGMWWDYLYGTVILLLCFVICIVGSAIYAKTTFIIFCVVMVSIVSVIVSFFAKPSLSTTCQCNASQIANYTGLSIRTFDSNLMHNFTHDYTTSVTQNFVTVFAVLFNGCTGIMAGANMSGDLKNPSRSIPIGTIAACIVTFFVYLILIMLISATSPRLLLQCSYSFLLTINVWQPFVAIGVFASSLSAALSCLIGASRILYQLGRDDIFGILLKPVIVTTSGGNPIAAVVASWLLVQLMLFAGKVNTIAPIVTIFFLFSYAAVDLACLALEWASAPNFRPTFKFFTWHTCVLGVVSCVTMMFLIQAVYTSISIVVLIVLLIGIHYRTPTSSWGYISQALIFHQVRKYMLMLDTRKEHVKFWRPQILLMVKNPRSCCQLIDFINSIKKSGLYVLGHVSIGHLSDMTHDVLGPQYNRWLDFVDRIGVKAFVELTLSASVREGTEHLLRISGLGGMKPNTLVLGFYDDNPQKDSFSDVGLISAAARGGGVVGGQRGSRSGVVNPGADDYDEDDAFFPLAPADPHRRNGDFPVRDYVTIIEDALKLRKNVCLARYFDQLDKARLTTEKMYVDVWPVNLLKPLLPPSTFHSADVIPNHGAEHEPPKTYFDTTCVFLMQMACILNMTSFWKKHTRLRIFLLQDANQSTPADGQIEEFLRSVRIEADIKQVSLETTAPSGGGGEPLVPANFVTPRITKETYLSKVNALIRDQLESTAVTFLYLPAPPSDHQQYEQYHHMLERLSHRVGPAFFVHGLSHVISTSL